MNFIRLFFHSSYVHLVEGGSELAHHAGQFYHVEMALAEELIAKGIASTEEMIEQAAQADRAKAAEDAANVAGPEVVAAGEPGPTE